MAEPRPPAKLFFLTEPDPGRFIANLQFEGNEHLTFEISRDQLVNAMVDGMAMIRRLFSGEIKR